jgi:LacI family transcriptional regulator
MREVARLAGVSVKTVSRVINGEPNVSADLVHRVQRAATQLDYHPDLGASYLRRSGRRTGIVGLMLEDVANPFSATLHRAFWDTAAARGLAVIASSLDEDPERERRIARAMIERRVDGLAVVPTGQDQSYLRSHIDAGLAVVFLDRPPVLLDADTALATNRAGAHEATRHLIRRGHRRIAFLGDLRVIATASERQEGYEQALRESGLPVDGSLIRRDLHDWESAANAVEELMRLPAGLAPTAIFASQNLVTIGAIRALHRSGLQRVVALVGFDQVELADLLDPGVTLVEYEAYNLGQTAAELLLTRIDGYRGPSRHEIVSTRLVARGSGEIGPGSQPRKRSVH